MAKFQLTISLRSRCSQGHQSILCCYQILWTNVAEIRFMRRSDFHKMTFTKKSFNVLNADALWNIFFSSEFQGFKYWTFSWHIQICLKYILKVESWYAKCSCGKILQSVKKWPRSDKYPGWRVVGLCIPLHLISKVQNWKVLLVKILPKCGAKPKWQRVVGLCIQFHNHNNTLQLEAKSTVCN